MNSPADHIKPDKSGCGSSIYGASGDSQLSALAPRKGTIIWQSDETITFRSLFESSLENHLTFKHLTLICHLSFDIWIYIIFVV